MTGPAPISLPRRANTIRAVAASLANTKLIEEAARQAVSDRVGYIVAAFIGAFVFSRWDWRGVQLLGLAYGVSAMLAFRKHKRIQILKGKPSAK